MSKRVIRPEFPALGLLVLAALPLIVGWRTLFYRDLFNHHLAVKTSQAGSMREGILPLIDTLRAGGQPLVGNLNSVALYPDNLLYLLADPIWALNAHMWIHFLLAPAAFFLLAREWGLSRTSAWAAGIFYVTSGFFFSQLNFYNTVPAAALAPAFVGLMMATVRTGAGSRAAATGLVWALLVLGGEPLMAVLALVAALSAACLCHGWRSRAWLWVGLSLGAGTLVALPQIVEFLRILPGSFRGSVGYQIQTRLTASWDPRLIVEWLVPLPFGRPGPGFWPPATLDGRAPLFLTLYPGLLALALVLASRRLGRRLRLWSWAMMGAGLFVALGGWNPLMFVVFRLPVASGIRFPVKAWILVAIGASLAAGAVLERCREADARRTILARLAVLATLLAALWAVTMLGETSFTAWLRGAIPDFRTDAFVAAEVLRWQRLLLISLAACATYALGLGWGARRWPWERVVGAMLLVHVASQILFLSPAVPTDDRSAYRQEPAILDLVDRDERIVHACKIDMACELDDPTRFPDPHPSSIPRLGWNELFPFAAVHYGIASAYDTSPDGLDAALVEAAGGSLSSLSDAEGVRLLAASGVDVLVTQRPLGPEAEAVTVLRGRRPSLDGEVYVYEISGGLKGPQLIGTVHRGDARKALVRVVADDFDPTTMAYLPGPAAASMTGPAGTASEIDEPGLEAWTYQTRSEVPGLLVTEKAYLSHYRALIDGAPVPVSVANLGLLAIEVPAGEHRVEIRVERGPFRRSLFVSLAGVLALAALSRRRPRREPPSP